MANELVIPKPVQETTLARLAAHARRYKVYGVEEARGTFKGPYLYVDYVEEGTGLLSKPRPSKLCRLEYTGDPENWGFAIYKYSDECYDEEADFPFGGGTVEACFDAAASLYIAECYPDLSPDLPTDEELAEYERGAGRFENVLGWELKDGTFLPGPGMVDYMMGRVTQDWREEVESRAMQLNTSLQAALNKQPGLWIEAIYAALGLGEATKKSERIKAIATELPAPEFLRDVLNRLPEESREALRFVMEKGGWVKYGELTRQFGDEEGDGWFWNEQPPTSTLGLLRLHGLLFVGKAGIGGRQWKVAIIPKELRVALAESLPGSATEGETVMPKSRKRKTRAERRKTRRQKHSTPGDLDSLQLPDRRAMEKILADLTRGLGEPLGPESNRLLAQAQEVMYQAWEASGRRRLELARQALAMSPDCADAYVLLAEESARSLEEACVFYAQGVAAGERALGPEMFQEYAGHFWGILETRPYMRARAGLAGCLWKMGQREAAIEHYEDMLRLNPNDNQGIRDVLAACYVQLGDDAQLQALLDRYPDDAMAVWRYTRALLLFRQTGDSPEARAQLQEAMTHNRHVPAYLLGRKRLPRQLPSYYGFGDENEAIYYAVEFIGGWQATPGALEWLARQRKV